MVSEPLILLFLLPYLAASVFEHFLVWSNDRHQARMGKRIPEVFQGTLDQQGVEKMRRYASDRNRFSTLHRITADLLLITALLSGWIQALDRLVHPLPPLLAGLLFMGILGLVSLLASLPFDWAHAFIVEKRHGFSTKTPRIWGQDQIKGFLLSLVLGTPLLAAVLASFLFAGSSWWILAFALIMGFQVLMIFVYPLCIAPLFNTFTPLPEGSLRERIFQLCKETGLDVRDVLVMDASRRTAHTNAYMTGLGRSRRVVLYDSLLEKHPEEEILAILAHEIGHWKFRHLPRQVFFFGCIAFLFLALAGKLLAWPFLYQVFSFEQASAHAGLFLLILFWTPAALILSPLSSTLSRRAEYSADAFARKSTGSGKGLQKALLRMAKDNLANIAPHPLYVFFHYTHPPLKERIEALEDDPGSGTVNF